MMELQSKNSDSKISFTDKGGGVWSAKFCGYNTEYTLEIKQDQRGFYRPTVEPDIQHEDEEEINYLFSQVENFNENRTTSDLDGVEDVLLEEEDNQTQDEEKNPYNPEKIRIETKNFSIAQIFSMMTDDKEIDLSPDFQRQFVWLDNKRKSRLIESIMLRIPLPVFYFSELENGTMQVIDGVQRLTVIRDFLNGKFKLNKLEYLDKCNGKFFPTPEKKEQGDSVLDAKFVRRIRQTQLVINIIDPDSPSKAKYDIFKRINSGGKQLNSQEIRNCMATPEARKLIKNLAHSSEFKTATANSVNDTRMAAQKLVTRFIGFYYLREMGRKDLKYSSDIEDFLNTSLDILNKSSSNEKDKIKAAFKNAMDNAYYLFGNNAFRKILSTKENERRALINKSLFTTWSVFLSRYQTKDVKKKFPIEKSLLEPLKDELSKKKDYYDAISLGTNSKNKMEKAFQKAEKLFLNNSKV